MPPIRRYVRISPHSCLEVRIFVDNPADISTWLLRPSKPALPRVFNTVKPLILPKLKEENERTRLAKGKSGKKKKSLKDVVKGDDFEVVVFLTEGQGRHEVVVKRREARETRDRTHHIEYGMAGRAESTPLLIRDEDGDKEDVNMDDIPLATDDHDSGDEIVTTKARRRERITGVESEDGQEPVDPYRDEKKKLGLQTRYDGFSIWGKILCLLVQRKPNPARARNAGEPLKAHATPSHDKNVEDGAQQALMQEWISSTQMPQLDEED